MTHGLRSYSPSWYKRNSSSLRIESREKEGGSDSKFQGSPNSVTQFWELGTTVKVLASSKTALPAGVKKNLPAHEPVRSTSHSNHNIREGEIVRRGNRNFREVKYIFSVSIVYICIYLLYYIFAYISMKQLLSNCIL